MRSIDSAISDFLLACEADGFSRSTLSWYRSLLGAFSAAHEGSLSDIDVTAMRRYLVALRGRYSSEDTVSAHVRALHKFWTWCSAEYSIPNPMKRVAYPRKPKPRPRAAQMDDIALMFQAAHNARDKAILAFLLDTGCRAGGLVGLRPGDVDMAQRRALVTEKGGQTRAVVFSSLTAALLALWLAQRQPAERLFYNLDNRQPLSPSGLYQLMKRLARRAGVQGRFNPHSLRHTFAREYIRGGGDLATLSKILGHSDVSTTVRHYTIFTDKEIADAHEKYSPMKQLKIEE